MVASVNDYTQFLDDKFSSYLNILQGMVEINSFTYNPRGVNKLAEMTANLFAPFGFSSKFIPSINPAFGNHLFMTMNNQRKAGVKKGSKKSIMLVSHLDTVFSPEEEIANDFHFHISGDRIYGPGTVDIKGGTVMIFMLMDLFNHFHPELLEMVDWVIALDASEETLSNDFGKLCLEHLTKKTIACLIFEGGTPFNEKFSIVTSRKGRAEFKVKAAGRGAHAGNYHKQGANAIVQLSDTIQKISSFTNYAQQLTFNVGVVQGGSVVNRVPHTAEATVEMRAFSPDVFQAGVKKIMALDGTTTISSHDGFPCRVSIEQISSSDPWPRDPATDTLFSVWEQSGAELGFEVVPEERGGLSDGNFLWSAVPTLDGLGPSGTNAHCSEKSPDGTKDQEYALIPSFIPKALLNLKALLKLINHASQR